MILPDSMTKAFSVQVGYRAVDRAMQIHGAMGYSRNLPLERMARDARMFTIGGGTAEILRTQIAGSLLGMKTPQNRDGYAHYSRDAAE